jgi:hypothetical protein
MARATSPRSLTPRWHELRPEIPQLVLSLLTQMIQHHLPDIDPADRREVADEFP